MGFVRTSADATSSSSSEAGPKVTLQPFGVVTRLGQAAVLIQLPGANFAAAATVQHEAHTGCTLGHLRQTLARGGAGGGGGEDLYSHQQKPLLNAGTSDVFKKRLNNHDHRKIDSDIIPEIQKETYQAEASEEG